MLIHLDETWATTPIANYESNLLRPALLSSVIRFSFGLGNPGFDNAVVEAFWGRMQVELLNRQRWRTRIELANAIFEYLEVFHNRQRRHSALGMHTPIEYERIHHDNPTPALQNQAS